MNISPIVTKTLAGCDDIIRQHKLACLRVTALLCCKEQLWVGTSAGAIVHVAIPHVPPNVSRLTATPNMTVCQMGHCGQCRFLTSVDLSPAALSRANSFGSSGLGDGSRRRMSLNVAALQQGKVYVISGGDGFEDFHDMTTDEGDDSIGREDSANYLLFWHV
uniref:Uncharacterized protein n=1 Tax=Plectus sambesii TaxID=2011161 RepID=A0A914XQ85_9BILA